MSEVKNESIEDKTAKAAASEISDDELGSVSGGVGGTSATCEKCITLSEFPKEGSCFGKWSNGTPYTCDNLIDSGIILKCKKCGYRKNS